MEKNVGTKERYVRIGLGIAAGLAAFKMRKSKLASGLLVSAAASALKSGVSQYCPMKAKLGLGLSENEQKGATRSFPPSPVHEYTAQSGAI
jgi:hypothetical protein